MEKCTTRFGPLVLGRVSMVLGVLLLSPFAAAQTAPEWRIFGLQGNDLVLYSQGQQHPLGAAQMPESGFSLRSGDMLQTGPGNFVEIQLIPDGHIVKLAENTFFLIQGSGNGGGFSGTLLYGRLRVVTGTGRGGVSLLAGNAALELQDGDWGIDYTVIPGTSLFPQSGSPRPILQVYNFRGSARLIPQVSGASGVGERGISLRALEWVSLDLGTSSTIMERKPLEREIIAYWEARQFQGRSPLAMPDTALPRLDPEPVSPPAPVVIERERLVPLAQNFDLGPFKQDLRIKNILILGGTVLGLAGVGFEGYGLYSLRQGDPATAKLWGAMGFIPLGLGLGSLILSLFVNPVLPRGIAE